MANKPAVDNINEAKNALNQYPSIGEVAFDMCDGILNNIKAFIHTEDAWKELFAHEKKVNQEYTKRIADLNAELKDRPPMDVFKEATELYIKARAWKSTEMLNFYDMLTKKYDL